MSSPDSYKVFVLPGEPKGSMDGPNYFTPARGFTQPTKAIVLLTDVFGLPMPNPKIVADHLAEHVGVDVWIPDLFNGRPPFKVEDLEPRLPDRAGAKMTWTNTVVLLFKFLSAIPRLFANRPTVVDPRVHEFINKIKSEKGYERIGAVGYSFGGAIATRLGATDLVNTIVIAHPISLRSAEIRAIKVPTSWLLAEEDMGYTNREAQIARSIFQEQEAYSNHVEYEFKIWKGTAHGFAMRPNLEVPEVKAGYEGSLDQTISWLKKTL
jgi:carboxymethylenebutenolidase